MAGLDLLRQTAFVITGPSKMGKSEFVKAMVKQKMEQPDTLVVNCMGSSDPDLRRFKVLEHGAILFDEGSPDLVQKHRDLFQAPRHDIFMAPSATGCYGYWVNLWRVKLVITCNGWYDMLEELKPADREWVSANTAVLSIDTKMYSTASA